MCIIIYTIHLFKSRFNILNMSKEKEKELRAWLEEDIFKVLDNIRDKLGLKNTTEVLRFLISEKNEHMFGESIKINLEINLGSIKPLLIDILNQIKKKD